MHQSENKDRSIVLANEVEGDSTFLINFANILGVSFSQIDKKAIALLQIIGSSRNEYLNSRQPLIAPKLLFKMALRIHHQRFSIIQ